jgi:hypothetical protein
MASYITAQELIARLSEDYDPAETVVYTLYSESDLDEQDKPEQRRIWEEIAPEVCLYIDNLQPDINEFIREMEAGA